jgi:hypothetical protein
MEKNPRSERDEDRRGINEHDGATRGGPDEAAIDEDELQSEQRAGGEARNERAVARGEPHAAQPRCHEHHRQGAERTQHALGQRRNVREGEFDRDLIEAPAQAQDDHQSGGDRVQRAARRRMFRAGPFRLHGHESRVRRFWHYRTKSVQIRCCDATWGQAVYASPSAASGPAMKEQKISAALGFGARPAAVKTPR